MESQGRERNIEKRTNNEGLMNICVYVHVCTCIFVFVSV